MTYVTEPPLSSMQSTLIRNKATMEHHYQRSNYPNRKSVTNYSNVVPGSTPYLSIVHKGKSDTILGDSIIEGIRRKEFDKCIIRNAYMHLF